MIVWVYQHLQLERIFLVLRLDGVSYVKTITIGKRFRRTIINTDTSTLALALDQSPANSTLGMVEETTDVVGDVDDVLLSDVTLGTCSANSSKR
eukprot:789073-Ditylum_brightwellii.AAC.1